jgi:deazaflavin-dependent oxidoreductase (nitroreductase family)
MTVDLQQTFLRFHGWEYRRSDGRVGHRMIGVPTMLPDDTGRRSGARRTNVLVYAEAAERYVVVPSNFGSDQHPAWQLDLRAQPQGELQVARASTAACATVEEQVAPEHARRWRLVDDQNHNR